MNLSQYAAKMLNVPLSELPLNHVDLCLLNELTYLPVDEVAEHHSGFARGVSAAQTLASAYWEANLAQEAKTPIYVTGHSKGGNLAIYAACTVSDEARARISEVLAFDVPGFSPAFWRRRATGLLSPYSRSIFRRVRWWAGV